jgi:hemerythrin
MVASSNNFAWGARYETGIPVIDIQHQSLFKALRYLQEAAYEGTVQAEVGVVLEFLEKYAQVHFATEEAYLQQIRFPGLLEHMAEHKKFTIQVQDFRARYLANESDVSMETTLFLFAWFRDHILIQDMAFAESARSASVGMP